MKPHIFRYLGGDPDYRWVCVDRDAHAFGPTPYAAYRTWARRRADAESGK